MVLSSCVLQRRWNSFHTHYSRYPGQTAGFQPQHIWLSDMSVHPAGDTVCSVNNLKFTLLLFNKSFPILTPSLCFILWESALTNGGTTNLRLSHPNNLNDSPGTDLVSWHRCVRASKYNVIPPPRWICSLRYRSTSPSTLQEHIYSSISPLTVSLVVSTHYFLQLLPCLALEYSF